MALASLLVLIPVGILGYGLRTNPRSVASPLVGRPAPGFVLPRFDGGQVALADLAGRVLVVNFWASWCVPCRQEVPALEAAWRRYRDAGVVVLGVNVQDRDAAARAFLREMRPGYANAIDASGVTSIAYGLYGVPETFVIDRAGRIRLRHVGAVTEQVLARAIEPLLRDGA